jgi:hypothetical protein
LKAHPQIDAVLPNGRTNRFELVFEADEKEFGKILE